MLPFDYTLAVTLAISEIWGVIVLWMGACVRFTLGNLVTDFIEGVSKNVHLDTAISPQGQNICPVSDNIGDDLNLGEWTVALGSILIAAGFLIFLFSVFGMVSASSKKVPLLILTLILIILSSALQIYLIMIAQSVDLGFHESAQDELVTMVGNEYVIDAGNSLFSLAMNGIMLVEECCGIRGMRDFPNLSFVEINEKGLITVYFKVPPACCKRALFNVRQSDNGFEILKQCAKDGWEYPDLINSEGCYTSVFNTLKSGPGSIIIMLFIFAIIWHVIQLLLVVLTILLPSRAELKRRLAEEKKKASIASERAEQERVKKESIRIQQQKQREEEARRKFVPYSKVSSFQHPDIKRIKSTEIW